MTHPSFRTDLDELGALADALVRAEHSLQGALDALRDTTAASIGTDALDSACQDFQEHWRHRLRQLRRQLDDTAEGVRATARGYAATEQNLVATVAPIPVPGPAR